MGTNTNFPEKDLDLSCILEEGLLDALQPKEPTESYNQLANGVSKFQSEYLDTLNGIGTEMSPYPLN